MSHKFSNSFLVCVFAHSKVLIMQTAFQITDNDRKQASTSIDCSHWCRWHCGDPRRRHRTPSKRWKAKRVSRADRESERSRWLLSWSNKGEGFSGRRHRLGTLHSLSASASAGTAVRRCLEAAPTACRLLLPPQNKQGEWIDDWKTSDPRRRERERLHNMAAWRRGGRRVNVRSLGKVSVLRGLSAGRQALQPHRRPHWRSVARALLFLGCLPHSGWEEAAATERGIPSLGDTVSLSLSHTVLPTVCVCTCPLHKFPLSATIEYQQQCDCMCVLFRRPKLPRHWIRFSVCTMRRRQHLSAKDWQTHLPSCCRKMASFWVASAKPLNSSAA